MPKPLTALRRSIGIPYAIGLHNKKYKSRLLIQHVRVLFIAYQKGGGTTSYMVRKMLGAKGMNLNHYQLKEYISYLTSLKFIEIKANKICLTADGLYFLKQIDQKLKIIRW